MATVNEGMSFINKSIYTGLSIESKALSGKTLLFRRRIDNLKPNGICLGSLYDIYHNTVDVLDMVEEPKHIIELSEMPFKKES